MKSFTLQKSIDNGMNQNESFSNKKVLLYILVISIVAITICSKSSPFYPLNDWVDSNIYMSIGKSMLDGKVPYRDLYDHKGPFIFALHAIASIVSRTSFLGVWFIEIACAFFFLFYSFKSLSLFCNKHALFWLPLIALLTYTSLSFAHGDSAEELSLPFLAYAMWIGLNAIHNKKYPSTWQLIAIGITSGCIFWMKYTVIGLYIGWFIALAVFIPKDRKLKQIWSLVWKIALGVIISTLPWLLYFGINHSIEDWLKVYFFDNFQYYPTERTVNILFHIVIHLGLNIKDIFTYNASSIIFLIVGVVYLFFKKKIKYAYYFILLFISSYFITYAGNVRHSYAPLVFSVFLVCGFICIDALLYNRLYPFITSRLWKFLYLALFIVLLYVLSSNTYMLQYDKEDLPQYKFKAIIDQTPDAKVLMYKSMDTGVYTVCNIDPEFKYFFYPNLQNEELEMEQKLYITEKECDYAILRIAKYAYGADKIDETISELKEAGYTEISRASYLHQNEIVTDLLFEK